MLQIEGADGAGSFLYAHYERELVGGLDALLTRYAGGRYTGVSEVADPL